MPGNPEKTGSTKESGKNLITSEQVIEEIPGANREVVDFLISKDLLNQGSSVKGIVFPFHVFFKKLLVKNNFFELAKDKNFRYLMECAKPENLEFAAEQKWLTQDNFLKRAESKNFVRLMGYAEPEKLENYAELDLINLDNNFYFQNYKVLEELENKEVLDLNSEDVVKKVKKLLEKNKGQLTPTLLTEWLKCAGKEQEIILLEKMDNIKQKVLFTRDDTDCDYDDPLFVECLALAYNLNSVDDIKETLKDLEDKTFDIKTEEKYSEKITQYQKTLKPNNIPKECPETLNLFTQEYQNSDPIFVKLLKLSEDYRVKNLSNGDNNLNFENASSLKEILQIIPKEEFFSNFLKDFDKFLGNEKNSLKLDVEEYLKTYSVSSSQEITLADLENIIKDLEGSAGTAIETIRKGNFKELVKDIVFTQETKEKTKEAKITELKNNLLLLKAKKQLKLNEVIDYSSILKIITINQTKPIVRQLEKLTSNCDKKEVGEINFDVVPTVSKSGFFAKETTEICTADNTNMYNKPYHYHLNIISDGRVVGNIMLYMFDKSDNEEFSNHLIARGFNITNEFLRKINPKDFVEKIIESLKDIAQKNDREGIYVPVQDSWHPLSNKDLIAKEITKIAKTEETLKGELDVNENKVYKKLMLLTKSK